MSRRLFVVLISLALAVVAGAVAVGWQLPWHDDSAAYVSEHATKTPETVRSVFVSRSMPMPSAHPLRLSAMLEQGPMPRSPAMAEVMTDTDCVPDEKMVSRCRNEMRLEDGGRVVLRHPHSMSKVPCLAAGERVRLIPTNL